MFLFIQSPIGGEDNLSLFKYFVCDRNLLTGTIPEDIVFREKLQAISLFSNYFTGTVPSSIALSNRLNEILINENSFSGRFFDLFQSANAEILQVINVANNIFSGTLPSESNLYTFPIESLSISSNCFSGTIPLDVCRFNKDITLLDFDGVGGNDDCIENIKIHEHIPRFIQGRFSTLGLSGTIPPCLFQLTRLNALHMSGKILSSS
jgi:hypothetical protein